MMRKHYVEFFSPGTFVAESTTQEVDSWDIDTAKKMASKITERHEATPYGFQFVTRERGAKDFDSKEVKRSPLYYLGGKVETLAEVEARKDPSERILVENMRGNGWDRIITNTNSWKWTRPLRKDDVVLDYTPPRRRAKR